MSTNSNHSSSRASSLRDVISHPNRLFTSPPIRWLLGSSNWAAWARIITPIFKNNLVLKVDVWIQLEQHVPLFPSRFLSWFVFPFHQHLLDLIVAILFPLTVHNRNSASATALVLPVLYTISYWNPNNLESSVSGCAMLAYRAMNLRYALKLISGVTSVSSCTASVFFNSVSPSYGGPSIISANSSSANNNEKLDLQCTSFAITLPHIVRNIVITLIVPHITVLLKGVLRICCIRLHFCCCNLAINTASWYDLGFPNRTSHFKCSCKLPINILTSHDSGKPITSQPLFRRIEEFHHWEPQLPCSASVATFYELFAGLRAKRPP
ncbi:uncharacterized protein G2W53_033011 [Senna tora]|uniref:Uncharacterized protein n=1 Tax=Senna tora TaxID=362788 RepID=A0A834SXH1_9FABA|nr:uncharacterized protein G2W53_033011 [Senna tora]